MVLPDPLRPPIGWPLLPRPDAHGRLAWPSLEESVRAQIEVILLTRPGELLMRPTFGAGLDRALHEPNTVATRRRIRDLVSEALARHEPRIALDLVDVAEVEREPTHVRVEVVYRLRRTGAASRIALTVDLEG